MRLTVIVDDLFVSKDGENYNVSDLSFLHSNIHAIQWYDTTGEIEYKDGSENTTITDITPYNQCVTAWETAKQAYEDSMSGYTSSS